MAEVLVVLCNNVEFGFHSRIGSAFRLLQNKVGDCAKECAAFGNTLLADAHLGFGVYI